nr:PAS domain-containing protein [Paludisphaera mucosa]
MIAPAAVAIAAVLTAATWPLCAPTPWAFFFAAVTTAAWIGGIGPCVVATGLSAVVGVYSFLPPYGSFALGPSEAGAVAVFLLVSAFIGFIAAARRAYEGEERGLGRFQGVVRSIADAVVATDGDGRVAFLNVAAERLTGWSRDQAEGKPIREVFALEPVADASSAASGSNEVRGVVTARDGVRRSVEGSFAPILDESGKPGGTVWTLRDVGERLAAETALHRSEELHRRLIDDGVDCLKVLSLDGRVLSMNEVGLCMMEIDDFEAIRDRSWAELWPEDSRERLREALRQAAAGRPAQFEGRCPTARGTVKEWDVRLTPILGPDGATDRIYAISRDVTARRRAESELLASEERYRTLFGSIDEGFCVIEMIYDEAGKAVDYLVLEANPAFATQTGIPDIVGKRMRDLIPNHDDHWFETYGQVAATGEPVRFVNQAQQMGGVWFDVYAFPVEGRESHKVAVLFKNITEAVLAEQERERLLLSLKNERAKLAAVIQNAPAFICTLRGPDHVFELANRLYYEMVGDRELIGKTVREAFPEVEGQGFFELLDQVHRSGDPFVGKEMPIMLRRRDTGATEKRMLNFVYQPTYEADGEISGLFVHGVDVTDMVNAREAVRDSEARFRQLADAMPQAVWAAKADGTIDYFNRKWREYGSYPEGVLGDARWARIIHPDDLERTRAAWQESVRTGRPFEIEYRLRRSADGRHRWHLGRALPIEDSRGRIVRWFGTNTDVDDVKRLSEALKQADRRKDEFLATLAHELRNPLAPIRNGLQILGFKPPEDLAAGTIDMMTRQLGHMVHLIDDLMDVARVGSGKITLRRTRVTLQSVAAGAIEASRQIIDASGHTLTAAIPPEPIPLDADPTRLTQVIANLLNNAAKYTEHGGRIELTVRREGGEAVVSVRDTGVGIDPEMLPRVFDMFTQVDGSLGRSQGGLGIGLTIVKRLVEMHGGRIEARSDGAGRGSEFVVHLPLAAGAVEAVAADGPGDGRPDREGRGAPGAIRVLVVDDNRDSANSLSRLLSLDRHDVHTAYDGAQALAEASAFPPDLILLDLGLPDRNGYEVAAELRANPDFRETMIIALTGWGQPEDRRRTREAGFDHHLVKPVDVEILRSILANVAEAARRRRENAVAVRQG